MYAVNLAARLRRFVTSTVQTTQNNYDRQHHGAIIIKTILNQKTFYVGLVLYITTVRVSYYSTESDGN
jgi:hypothetical protein